MFRLQPWLALLLALLALPAAPAPLEIITLQHRSAEELLPVLRPLLDAQGALTGQGDHLFVRTTPENLLELKAALRQLDLAPRRLLITVRQTQDLDTDAQDADAQARVRFGQGGQHLASGDTHLKVRGRIATTGSRDDASDTQQLQVTEGYPAFIEIGEAVPVMDSGMRITQRGPVVTERLGYRDLTRGFQVLARTNGDRVTLEINPQRAALDDGNGTSINTQQLHTTVSGALGEWLELGSIGTEARSETSPSLLGSVRHEFGQRRIQVKVEPLP